MGNINAYCVVRGSQIIKVKVASHEKNQTRRNDAKIFAYTVLSVPDHWSEIVTVYLSFFNV